MSTCWKKLKGSVNHVQNVIQWNQDIKLCEHFNYMNQDAFI